MGNPRNNIVLLLNKRSTATSLIASVLIFPLKTFKYPAIKNGTIKQTIEGNTTVFTKPKAVTLLAIQSIVVVTSPIGDQAPPAFAAITTIAAYQRRSSLSCINFRNK